MGVRFTNSWLEIFRHVQHRTVVHFGSCVERFIAEANREAADQDVPTEVIRDRLDELSELVAGYAFTDIVTLYWEGYQENDDEQQHAALRWFAW